MAQDLCADIYTPKTSLYTVKTSPYTALCRTPIADIDYEFMDSISLTFMDGVNFQFLEA